MPKLRVAIVGAGLAGLCTARDLLRRGEDVIVIDRGDPGRGASWAAAGMLAPTFETATESMDHPAMFDLLFEALDYWRGWQGSKVGPVRETVGYRDDALIALATTAGEAGAFERLSKYGRARALTCVETKMLAPRLADDGLAAFALPMDGQVDNRALVTWLLSQITALGGHFERAEMSDDAMTPHEMGCDVVVDARGWRVPGMTPVKGTAMSLAPHAGLPDRVVRWGRNYLVPKSGRIVLGAHAMAGLTDTSVDREIIEELRDDAADVFPAVRDADILETWSGVRPRPRDGAPYVGWVGPGQYVVGGMYRDGVLLSPLLGRWAATEISGADAPDQITAFRPTRFTLTQG
ncbi:MAG: FAD-dependent oxidoreductase [Pseudomonadota bacterium]